MKKIILSTIGMLALAAASQPAAAADLLVKAPILKAPPAPIFSWTGFYIGVHTGGGWGRKEENSIPFTLGGATVTPLPASVDVSGWLGGGQVGFNYQGGPGWFGGNWVFGIEAQGSWSDLNGSSACAATTPVGVVAVAIVTLNSTCNVKVDSLGTVALRYGTAYGRLLLYGKIGGAWTHDKYNSTAAVALGGISSFDGSETRIGWMSGTGIEYAVTDNWSVKAEYNYMNMGTQRVRLASTPAGVFVDADIKEVINVVKFGINYRFGPETVIARY